MIAHFSFVLSGEAEMRAWETGIDLGKGSLLKERTLAVDRRVYITRTRVHPSSLSSLSRPAETCSLIPHPRRSLISSLLYYLLLPSLFHPPPTSQPNNPHQPKTSTVPAMAAPSNEKDYEKGVNGDAEETHQMLEVKLEGENAENILPSPVQAQQPSNKPRLSAAAIIPIWIVLSSSVIIYNNYLYNSLQFRFPVFLVTWHLTFAVCRYRPDICARMILTTLGATGYRNTGPATHNSPRRWRERRACL